MYEERSLDDRFERVGGRKCVCGHWTFQHEIKFKGFFFSTSYHTWCKNCTCEKFTLPETIEGCDKS